MNELEAKCYLTKQGGANNSDHTCILYVRYRGFQLTFCDRDFHVYISTTTNKLLLLTLFSV